jgi:YD repeat-containing protein
MRFFNIIANAGLGHSVNQLDDSPIAYGQAQLAVDANVINGNVCIQDFQKTFIDLGFKLQVGFTYNSLLPGWKLNLGKSLKNRSGELNSADSSIELVGADGHIHRYVYENKRGCYVCTSDLEGLPTLTYEAGQWLGFDPLTGITDRYNDALQLVRSTDRSGRSLQYLYNTAGQIAGLKGESCELGIEYSGDLVSIYDLSQGKKTLWMQSQFDTEGRLRETAIPVNATENYKISYGYTANTALIKAIQQSDRTCLSIQYDENNRVKALTNGAAVTHAFSYYEETTSIKNPSGTQHLFTHQDKRLKSDEQLDKKKVYEYDANKRLEQIRYEDNTSLSLKRDEQGFLFTVTDRCGGKSVNYHDPVTGLKIAEVESGSENPETLATTYFIYNAKGQCCYQIDGTGAVSRLDYDDKGNNTKAMAQRVRRFDITTLQPDKPVDLGMIDAWWNQQDPQQITLTEQSHNARGQITKKVIYATIDKDGTGIFDALAGCDEADWDIHGHCLRSVTRLNTNETAESRFQFDGLERLCQETDPLEQVILHSFRGNQSQTTAVATGLTEITTHDTAGREVSKEQQAKEATLKNSKKYDIENCPSIYTDSSGSKRYIIYNQLNRAQYEIDTEGAVIEYRYDNNNYIKHQINYQDKLTSVDEEAIINRRFVMPANAALCIKTEIRDAFGRTRFLIDGENQVIERQYDASGNLAVEIAYATRLTMSREEWEAQGYPLQTSSDDRRNRFFNDSAGNLIATQDPLGMVTVFSRDAIGSLCQRKQLVTPHPLIQSWPFDGLIETQLDKIDTYKTDGRQQTSWHLDAENIVSESVHDAAGREIEIKRAGKTLHRYQHDKLNRQIADQQMSGLLISRRYHPCGKVQEETKSDIHKREADRTTKTLYNSFGAPTHHWTARTSASADLAESIRYHYIDGDVLAATTNELGHRSHCYHNHNKELLLTVSATGAIVEYGYDIVSGKPNKIKYYDKKIDPAQLALLQGGYINPELIALLHRYSDPDKDVILATTYSKTGLTLETINGDGYAHQLEYNAFGEVTVDKNQIDSDRWLVSNKRYDQRGRMLELIGDPNGLHTRQAWEYKDTEALVIHTSANNNKTLTFTDKLDRVTRVEDESGIGVSTAWDGLSRIIKKSNTGIRSLVPGDEYKHSDDGLLIHAISAMGTVGLVEKNVFDEVIHTENSPGESSHIRRDCDGQIAAVTSGDITHAREYDLSGQLVLETNGNGIKDKLIRDADGFVIEKVEDVDNLARSTKYRNNTQGKPIETRSPANIPTLTEYDKRGNITKTTIDPEGLGLVESTTYNGLNKSVLESQGDLSNPRLREKNHAYDDLGRHMETITDPQGLHIRTAKNHDMEGNIIEEIDANGNVTRLFHDRYQRERFRVDAMGGVTGKWYDPDGNCIEERRYAKRLDAALLSQFTLTHLDNHPKAPEDKAEFHQYNVDHQCIATINNLGKYTAYCYNARGLITSENDYATPVSAMDFSEIPPETEQDRYINHFYDKNNREIFTVDGQGIVNEKRWDAAGNIILKKTYAKQWLQRDIIPDRDALSSPADRWLRFYYDTLNRLRYEIDCDGFVTENEYGHHNQPETIWKYPQSVSISPTASLADIAALLPEKTAIPHINIQYDNALRKSATMDELGNIEKFILDASGSLTSYVDKANEAWGFTLDSAGRKAIESTPELKLTRISQHGSCLIAEEIEQAVHKKLRLDQAGNTVGIIEGYGSDEARELTYEFDACHNPCATSQKNVRIDDPDLTPLRHTEPANDTIIIDHSASLYDDEFVLIDEEKHAPMASQLNHQRPEKLTELTTHTVYNAFNKPIVLVDEAGACRFRVYGDSGLLAYEIDSEGFVIGFEYNVFGQTTVETQYAKPIGLNLQDYSKTGLSIDVLATSLMHSPEDRHRYHFYDLSGRLYRTKGDAIDCYIPAADGEHSIAKSAPVEEKIHNTFGEAIATRRLIDPVKNTWEVKRQWVDTRGAVLLSLDASNYATFYQRDRYGKETKRIEYANPLEMKLTDQTTLSETLAAVILSPKDRYFSKEYNERGELTAETQHQVVTQSTKLDAEGKPQLIDNPPQDLRTVYERDAKGRVENTILPNGKNKLTRFDARDLPVLQTGVPRTVDHSDDVIPVVTTGYNTFGQLARVTRHANPLANDAYLSSHPDDQVLLTQHDTRGVVLANQDAKGTLNYQSYTATKQMARSWLWVTGYQQQQRLHQSTYDYNLSRLEIRREEKVEGGGKFTTATLYNGFREKIGEGPGDGNYPVYWQYNRSGNIWNTNEENGIATVKLHDLRGNETLTVRSKQHNLANLKDRDIPDLLTWDHTESQQISLIRDRRGDINEQWLPAFSATRPNEPEPLDILFSCGKSQLEFGAYSITWQTPVVKGLEPVFSLWPRDNAELKKTIDVKYTPSRSGVDLSVIDSDHYQFCIDFYYCDPESKALEASPRYRTYGDAMVINPAKMPQKGVLWELVDDTKLKLYGDATNVSGIELSLNNQPVKRLAVSATEDKNVVTVALDEQLSGEYEFKLVYGYSLLEEKPLSLSQISPSGSSVSITQTTANHKLTYIDWKYATVETTWGNLPTQLAELKQEVITSTLDEQASQALRMIYKATSDTVSVPSTETAITRSQFVSNKTSIGLFEYTIESWGIVQNRLYLENESSGKQLLFDVSGANENHIPPYAYVVSTQPAEALIELDQNDAVVKTMGLQHLVVNNYRCQWVGAVDNTNRYQLATLQQSTVQPTVMGSFTLHSQHRHGANLLAREVRLKNLTVAKILLHLNNPRALSEYSAFLGRRWAMNLDYDLPKDISANPVIAKLTIRFFDGINNPMRSMNPQVRDFEFMVTKHGYLPYNSPMLPALVMSDDYDYSGDYKYFDVLSLELKTKMGDDWITLLNTVPAEVRRGKVSKNLHSEIALSLLNTPIHSQATITSDTYDEADIARFPDTSALLFYPIPATVAGIKVEYYDSTLPQPAWREMANVTLTGTTVSVPADAISAGNYTYRLKAWDNANQPVNLSSIATMTTDGWTTGKFQIRHGGDQILQSQHAPARELLHPKRKQTQDRWGNLLTSTSASGNVKDYEYSSRDKLLAEIAPAIEATNEDGSVATLRPVTRYGHNINNHTIGVLDANNHATIHERDDDGNLLKTTLATGVPKCFVNDIFGRPIQIIDALGHVTRQEHDHNNTISAVIDANQWRSEFGHNELNLPTSHKNGKGEVSWSDYLLPLSQPTHQYLPLGQSTATWLDRFGNNLSQTLADGREQTWERDYFGLLRQHKDLGGALIDYLDYDYVRNLGAIKSHGGNHGERMYPDHSKHPQADRNCAYQYDEASNTIAIIDNAIPLTTRYRLDIERRRVGEIFIGSDGVIHQAVMMKWNALNWLIEIQDTNMKAQYNHDAYGNRRTTLAFVNFDGQWDNLGQNNWYSYDEANQVLINRGSLIDGKIRLQPGKGTQLIYNAAGSRHQEISINSANVLVTKTLHNLDNGLLESITSSDGNNYKFEYDAARRRTKTISRSHIRAIDHNSNGWLLSENVHDLDEKMQSVTRYDLNVIGLPGNQTTTVRTDDGHDGYEDKLTNRYVPFDTDLPVSLSGTRHRMQGDEVVGYIDRSLDPNGNVEFIQDGKTHDFQQLITTSEGRIVHKKNQKGEYEFFFYTTSGEQIGRFGNIPELVAAVRGQVPVNSNFDLNFHPASENFPPPAPQQYTVSNGDTFADISQAMYGDSSYADVIASHNGYKESEHPTPGQQLDIPNDINTSSHNWQGQYAPYHADAIIGSVYPEMPMPSRPAIVVPEPPHKQRQTFWHTFVESVMGAVIMSFAPELAVAFGGELLGTLMGGALAGAASSIVQQETAALLGDKPSISWSDVGKSALVSAETFGMAKAAGIDLGRLQSRGDILASTKGALELSAAMQALQLVTRQQKNVDWRTIVSAALTSGANAGVSHLSKLSLENITPLTSTVADIEIDHVINRNNDIALTAANALGVIVGNNIAGRAKAYYAEYEANKFQQDEADRIKLPSEQRARKYDISSPPVTNSKPTKRDYLNTPANRDRYKGLLFGSSIGINAVEQLTIRHSDNQPEIKPKVSKWSLNPNVNAAQNIDDAMSSMYKIMYGDTKERLLAEGNLILMAAILPSFGKVASIPFVGKGLGYLGGKTLSGLRYLENRLPFFGRLMKPNPRSRPLDWSHRNKKQETAAEHIIINHRNMRLDKPNQGIFYGNPITVVEESWESIHRQKIAPVRIKDRDHYIIPRQNSGFAGGYRGQLGNYDHITIITEADSSTIVTAFPSGRTAGIPNDYQFKLEVENARNFVFNR